MQEYLGTLQASNAIDLDHLIRGLQANVPDAVPVPVLVAALGPLKLNMTGEFADGTSTWMVGPKTLENHVVKTIAAAQAAGRLDSCRPTAVARASS
jgi:hypothetical protein